MLSFENFIMFGLGKKTMLACKYMNDLTVVPLIFALRWTALLCLCRGRSQARTTRANILRRGRDCGRLWTVYTAGYCTQDLLSAFTLTDIITSNKAGDDW